MEIKTYNKTQLMDLVHSRAYEDMPVIPISTHRAISHIHNPRAEKEDILMIIAFDGGTMRGYLGVLADHIYNDHGERFKCGWLSCMWVDPALRGKGIAKNLLSTALQSWSGNILVTEFTPEAKGLYDRSEKFTELRTLEGLRCYLRFNLHEILPKKNDKYKRCTPLLKWIDDLANLSVDLRLSMIKAKMPGQPPFEIIAEAKDLPAPYILSKQANNLERRDADDLNWIINYPWLKESQPTGESRKYHFSSVSARFVNLRFKLIEAGEVRGFLHFTIRDSHLKIPYAYFEPHLLKAVTDHICRIMLEYKLNMLSVFHPALVGFFSSDAGPFIYRRSIKRQYIISKTLAAHFADKAKLLIQDGDADCAFT